MTTLSEMKMKSHLYHYAATVIEVYDGDTLTVDLDLGLGLWRSHQTIRLWKINTPEVKGADREQGLAVRDFVRGLVLNKTILLRTILDKRGADRTEKFGRLLGEILVADEQGVLINVNDLLLAQGMAKPMGSDGSSVEATARGATSGGEPTVIRCRYCGEQRTVDTSGTVAACPNCLDAAYPIGG